MAELCADVLVDILSRLPVESLMRFKCVSRSWYELINNPDFINLHLHQSIQTKSNQTIIFDGGPSLRYLYNIDLDTFEHLHIPNQEMRTELPVIDQKTINKYKMPYILASCNGLLWLTYFPLGINPIPGFLYNPLTRSYRQLPRLPSRYVPCFGGYEYHDWRGYGFGYDSVNDDYKVVGIFEYWTFRNKSQSIVMIYSSKSNSWKKGEELPCIQCLPKMQHVVSTFGYFYWIAYKNSMEYKKRIIGFNVSDESYKEVEQPQSDGDHYFLEISSLDGCLCITMNYRSHCDFWIMKEHGMASSWTKLLRIVEDDVIYRPFRVIPTSKLRGICFSKDRRKLFLVHQTSYLASYDLEKRTSKKIEIEGHRECRYPISFVKSLVSFDEVQQLKTKRSYVHEDSKQATGA